MGIKLFGKTIQMPMAKEVPVMDREECGEDNIEAASNIENHERKHQDEEALNSSEEESNEENYPGTDEDKVEMKYKTDEQQKKESSSSMDNSLEKPEKVLPCPRCNSMDTKFCYYNNYNVKQPRYFCKNCQRYWTSGGSMRNVPVGAGRRKTKSSAVNHHQCNNRARNPAGDNLCESIHLSSPLKPTETLLNFVPDSHLNQSTAPAISPMKQKINGKAWLDRSLTTTLNSNSDDMHKPTNSNLCGLPPYLNHTPANFHIPFYTLNTFWGIPWLTPQPLITPIAASSCPLLNSTSLGKHAREGRGANQSNSDKSGRSSWIPKTVRIDDSEDAANCSIMATLGLKKGKADSFDGGEGFFKPFRPVAELKNRLTEEASRVLCANPAALSRSLCFQER